MGPAELFDQDSNNVASTPAGVDGGGDMSLTDLVPDSPNSPMGLTTANPSAPFGLFKYDFVSTQDAGFTNTAFSDSDPSSEGQVLSYHWHDAAALNPASDQQQLVARSVATTTGGLIEVNITDTEIQVGLDPTGFAAGDIIQYNGTTFINYELDDGSDSTYIVGSSEPMRAIRGDVNSDGSAGHGNVKGATTIWTSSNTGVGLFSVSFGFAFPDTPAVVVSVEYNVPSNRPRIINFTGAPATGGFAVIILEDVAGTWTPIDVGFHFHVLGLNGNY